MKFAMMIIAYNEQDIIRGCLEGFQDVDKFVSISKPWSGKHVAFDKTKEYAIEKYATVFLNDFASEKDQRNFVMEKLQQSGYDYVFIVDADEYYLREDVVKMINFVEQHPESERFNVGPTAYLWKNAEWETLPRFNNVIPVCYKSNMRFDGFRNIMTPKTLILPEDIKLYHFSFAGRDDRILNKLEHFSHSHEMDSGWFDRVWKKWTPEMEDLHPHLNAGHIFKKAIPFPCPEEIRERFYQDQQELKNI